MMGNIPGAPKSLGTNGKAHWKQLMGWLEEYGQVEAVDMGLLEGVCMAYDNMLAAGKLLRQENVDAVDPQNQNRQRKHPMFQVWRDSYTVYIRGLSELGVTRRSRGDIQKPPTEPSKMMRILDG